jgi:tRNA(Glu) U13 pseudouridine synthase TruD
VLQGLKRYGNDNPLAALKCLHFGVRAFWINAYQSYVWNKMATARIGIFGTSVVEGDLYYVGDERNAEIDVVKEGMTDSIQLSQVVLPLPGYNIRYPENLIGDLYRELLRNESVVFERDAPPEATAKGGYRRLVAAVERFTVTVEEGDGASEFVESMKLTFDLKRGMYATSMLRELMVTTIGRDGAPLNGQEG